MDTRTKLNLALVALLALTGCADMPHTVIVDRNEPHLYTYALQEVSAMEEAGLPHLDVRFAEKDSKAFKGPRAPRGYITVEGRDSIDGAAEADPSPTGSSCRVRIERQFIEPGEWPGLLAHELVHCQGFEGHEDTIVGDLMSEAAGFGYPLELGPKVSKFFGLSGG